MSNITKDQALEQIFEEVLDLDQQGLLEEDIRIICDVYGLHEDDDRDEILGFIDENRFYKGAIYYKEKI